MQIAITALEDDRILPFRNVRDRDLRRTHDDGFLVEGEVVLPVLLGQTERPVRAILVSVAQAERLRVILATVPDEVPIYVAPLPLLEQIVGFPMHRGVMALASRGPEPALDAILSGARVVGLCGITNHDNVGGIFRNAAAFGADAVLLDGASCDPLYRKAVRVSVGGSIVVPFAYVSDEAAMIESLTGHGYTTLALSPRGDLVIGRDAPPRNGKIALLLGAEGPGLSEATLRACTTARIEMRPGWDSLNVAATSAIALHWLR